MWSTNDGKERSMILEAKLLQLFLLITQAKSSRAKHIFLQDMAGISVEDDVGKKVIYMNLWRSIIDVVDHSAVFQMKLNRKLELNMVQ